MMPHTFVFLLLFTNFGSISLANEDERDDDAVKYVSICQQSTKKTIFCPTGTFIYIKSGLFGLFKAGECKKDIGHECRSDVTRYIEDNCSGRDSCNVTTIDTYLLGDSIPYYQSCDPNFVKSLEIKYSCKEYYNPPEAECKNRPIVISSTKFGLLSSLAVQKTGKGSKSCPWSFHIGPSQTLVLNLWDFRVWSYQNIANDEPNKCLIYASIRSPDYQTMICPGEEIRRRLYARSDGVVDVTLYSGEKIDYLIQFEVLDCSLFNPPSFVRIIRSQGSNYKVECLEGHRNVLTVHCTGGAWSHISRKNCSIPELTTLAFSQADQMTQSILIVVVIALAAIISLAIIFIGLYCLQACPFQRNRNISFNSAIPAPQASLVSKHSSENLFLQPFHSMREIYPMLENTNQRIAAEQRDYATTLQMRQMAGCYSERTAWCPAHGPYNLRLGSTNTIDRCNTLKMKRNLSTPISNCHVDAFPENQNKSASPSSPFYHELDQITLKLAAGQVHTPSLEASDISTAACLSDVVAKTPV